MILGVDVGGTFTDAVLAGADGVRTSKAPTTPEDQSRGVMAAVEQVLDGRPPSSVARFVHGMTVGTNALLEGRTATTALVATEGFTDIEELGRQARPDLYRLCEAGPAPLVPAELRVAAPERCGPGGELSPLDREALRARLRRLPADVGAVAVCLLWGFRHPDHEREVAALVAEERPAAAVSTSHETAAVFREHERCATTVVDAAVTPLLRDYLGRLTAAARDGGLPEPEIMLSSGGVVDASTAAGHGSWTVLSGPAGGAEAAARSARAAGLQGAVGLDMGGTSCDVSLVLDGRVAVTGGRSVAGRSLALPMVDVHTIGAGGGSVAWRDAGGALRVGPRSAGADPGPACYGRGGTEPTVTDADLLLGRLDPGRPLAGVQLDRDAAGAAVASLASELGMDLLDAAAGIARVADAEIAQAVRAVTVERGVDPRELGLVAFGGAGPLHAAAVAAELGIATVVVPEQSGVLSALGLCVSERRRDVVESVLLAGDAITAAALREIVDRLGARGRDELGEPRAVLRATYELRYAGQAFELAVAAGTAPEPTELRKTFDAAHHDRYGYSDTDAELELVTVRVAAAVPGGAVASAPAGGAGVVRGPASVALSGSTAWVPEGWRLRRGGPEPVMERDG